MEFSQRKLPKEAAPNLRLCPIHTVQPFALMLAPVYVYMKINEKFVAVKAPLDFFTPEELERLKPFESVFLPEFVDSALPFKKAARQVLALLSWKPEIPPAPYELSDAVLRILGPLWGGAVAIEPFFAAVFANELCHLLPGESLRQARDRDVLVYERAIFRSSWAVFLALHLGFCELEFLNRLRLRIFDDTIQNRSSAAQWSEVDELVAIACDSLDGLQAVNAKQLTGAFFSTRGERVCQKITSRLERVKASLAPKDAPVPTIYGERGFVDV